MNSYLHIIVFIFFSLQINAQEKHRRAEYQDASIILTEQIDSIVIYKAKREMVAFKEHKKIKTYMISLGIEPAGRKCFEGDLRTPEGLYYINDRSKKSAYHANLGVSYPNQLDSIYARLNGQRAGGDIKIHGFPNKHRRDQEIELLNSDWTIGCIAISDWEVDELYKWVKIFCPIFIQP